MQQHYSKKKKKSKKSVARTLSVVATTGMEMEKNA